MYRKNKRVLSILITIIIICSSIILPQNTALAASNMSLSNNGFNLIKSFEGCRLTAYKAVSSEQYYTIGYGHYGADVYQGMTITQQQAEDLFRSDLVRYVNSVNTFLNVNGIKVTQNQFDALVSFTYNNGENVWTTGEFSLKTYLIKGVNNYTREQITTAFTNWCHDRNHNVLQGLVSRRQKEAAYFLSGVIPPDSSLTIDSMYETPLICYTINTGNVTTYQGIDTPFGYSSYITGSTDQCTINQIYTNGWVQVTYPISSGTKTAYAKLSDFINSGVTHYNVKVTQNTNVFRRSDLSQTIGTVYASDTINVVGKSGSNLQIIYPISGGYKMGWISENAVEQPKKNYNLSLRVWASDYKMGKTPRAFKPKEMHYLCYELIDKDTGQVLINDSGLSYTVTETIYNPDGTTGHTCSYENSTDNWIGFRGNTKGTFKGTVSVQGDINLSSSTSWTTAAPAVKVWISDTAMGQEKTSLKVGSGCYLCYWMIDNTSGLDLDDIVDYDYTIKTELYDGDGKLQGTKNFSEDRGYLYIAPGLAGEYKGIFELAGDFIYSTTVKVNVEPKETAEVKELSVTGLASAVSVKKGEAVTIKGKAAGGSQGYTYSYLIHNKDTNQWSRLTPNFITSDSYTWTAGSAGNREFFVEVKDSTGKIVRSKAVNVTVQEKNLAIMGKANKSSMVKGEKVIISGTASGGSQGYTYSYLIHNKNTNQWSRLTSNFITSDSYTWTAGSAGNREFFVEVKDSTGKVVRSSAINVSVMDKSLSVNGKTSASTVVKGGKITISGVAEGGTGKYMYSFLVHNKDTNQWSRLTPNFAASNSYIWTAGSAGNREFFVEVKDSSGKVMRSRAVNVTTTENIKPLSIVAGASASNGSVGNKVTFIASAEGGKGGYTYSYLVHNKDTNAWSRLTPKFITANSYTWTAGSKGNREFFVEVKDSTGKVVRSKGINVGIQ